MNRAVMMCKWPTPGRWRSLPVVLALALLTTLPVWGQKRGHGPGYVDGTVFLDLVGEDNVRVEVSISRSLINIITSAHPDLKELAGGLESIHAIVAELSGDTEKRALDAIRSIDRKLDRDGWERVARVRDEESEVKVLFLNDGEAIEGMVVMVVDRDDREVIFVNIAGRVDPEAIQLIGAGLEIPGLEDLDGIDLNQDRGDGSDE